MSGDDPRLLSRGTIHESSISWCPLRDFLLCLCGVAAALSVQQDSTMSLAMVIVAIALRGMVRDQKSEPSLTASPNWISTALDSLNEGLIIVDQCQRIVFVNQAFCEQTTNSKRDLLNRPACDLPWAHTESQPAAWPWVRAIQEIRPFHDQVLRYRLADDDFLFFSVDASPIQCADKSGGVLITLRDVTCAEQHRSEMEQTLVRLQQSREEIRTKNRELQMLATRDPLTNCLNRRALMQCLDEHHQLAQSPVEQTCFMIDIDHFKQINDRYGHESGDQVLRSVASTIHDNCPDRALVCRYGGEEFCVMIPDCHLTESIVIAETIRQKVEELFFDEEPQLLVSVSIGVADNERVSMVTSELINRADKCLYIAKRSGRNQVKLFHESVGDEIIAEIHASREDRQSVTRSL